MSHLSFIEDTERARVAQPCRLVPGSIQHKHGFNQAFMEFGGVFMNYPDQGV